MTSARIGCQVKGSRGDKLATIGGCREQGRSPGPDVGTIDPFHVHEHLRLKQRGLGLRSGPRMEMESPRVEIPTSNCLFHIMNPSRVLSSQKIPSFRAATVALRAPWDILSF